MAELANVLELMSIAVKLAKKAALKGEIPVGALVCRDNTVLSKGINRVEAKTCQIFHAEAEAILKACKKLKNWRLTGCFLITTLQPCPMCAYLAKISRIEAVYYCLDSPLAALNDQLNIKLIKVPDLFDYEREFKTFFEKLRS